MGGKEKQGGKEDGREREARREGGWEGEKEGGRTTQRKRGRGRGKREGGRKGHMKVIIPYRNISLSVIIICLVKEKKRVEPLEEGEVYTKS